MKDDFFFFFYTLLFNFLSLSEETSVQNFRYMAKIRYVAKISAHSENFAILAKISLF